MSKISLSRAWEETSAVLKRDGRLFLAVALALFVLPGLVMDIVMPEARPGELPAPGLWMALVLAMLLIWLVGQLAVIRLALGRHVSVGEAIAHGAKRLLPYLAAVLIWILPFLLIGSALSAVMEANPASPSLAAALALIALVVVGLYLFVRLILSSAVASSESAGPVTILRRSWELTRGNWWRLFAFVLLFWIGALCALWAVSTVVGLLVQLAGLDTGQLSVGRLLIGLVSQIVNAVVSVILSVMLARIYAQRSAGGEAQVSVPSSGT